MLINRNSLIKMSTFENNYCLLDYLCVGPVDYKLLAQISKRVNGRDE